MKTHRFPQKNRKRLMINSLGNKKDLPKKSLFLDFQTNLYYSFLKNNLKEVLMDIPKAIYLIMMSFNFLVLFTAINNWRESDIKAVVFIMSFAAPLGMFLGIRHVLSLFSKYDPMGWALYTLLICSVLKYLMNIVNKKNKKKLFQLKKIIKFVDKKIFKKILIKTK